MMATAGPPQALRATGARECQGRGVLPHRPRAARDRGGRLRDRARARRRGPAVLRGPFAAARGSRPSGREWAVGIVTPALAAPQNAAPTPSRPCPHGDAETPVVGSCSTYPEDDHESSLEKFLAVVELGPRAHVPVLLLPVTRACAPLPRHDACLALLRPPRMSMPTRFRRLAGSCSQMCADLRHGLAPTKPTHITTALIGLALLLFESSAKWVQWRAAHLWGFVLGNVVLLLRRMLRVFVELPVFVAIAFVGTLAIAWCTSRRMPAERQGCLWTCQVVGGDGPRHYLAFLILQRFASAPRRPCGQASEALRSSSILCRLVERMLSYRPLGSLSRIGRMRDHGVESSSSRWLAACAFSAMSFARLLSDLPSRGRSSLLGSHWPLGIALGSSTLLNSSPSTWLFSEVEVPPLSLDTPPRSRTVGVPVQPAESVGTPRARVSGRPCVACWWTCASHERGPRWAFHRTIT